MVYHVLAGEGANRVGVKRFGIGLRQGIRSVGHRRHDDRHDTGQVSVPRRTLLVFTMTPHTSRLLVLTHSDATNPIPSAAQQLNCTNETV